MTLADILTLRVDFRDPEAAARITPAQAGAYLAAHGWQNIFNTDNLHVWILSEERLDQVVIPRSQGYPDYGRCLTMTIGKLAEHEARSPLAVFVEMITVGE